MVTPVSAQDSRQLSGIESRVLAIFMVAGLVLLVAGFYIYRMTETLALAEHWVAHTELVRTKLSRFYATALENKADLDVYLLTEKALGEQQYLQHEKRLETQFNTLNRLISDNPVQKINAAKLHRLTYEFETVLTPPEKTLPHDPMTRQVIEKMKTGNELIGRINMCLQHMNTIEGNLLMQRQADMENTRNQALLGLFSMLLLALASFIPLWNMIRREIIARADAEALATQLSNQLRTLLMSASEVSIIATDKTGTITVYNTGAENLLGYRANEIIGRVSPIRFHDVDELNQRARELRQEFNGQELTDFDVLTAIPTRQGQERKNWTYVTKGGMRIAVSLGITCIHDKSGEIIGYLGIALDISERQRLEQSLVEAKEIAEQANHAKSNFLAMMSHEIRTPLTGMLGMLELLVLTSMDKEQRTMLNLVWDSSRNLLRIVNDILDWSKIEEGKLSITLYPTSIPELLTSIINTYSGLASAKGLILQKYCDPGMNGSYLVDPLRLAQILNNFISNAIKFTNRGEIELRAEVIAAGPGTETLRFSVRDTGIGIAVSAQAQLFQRYQQENADTTRMYGGTGLGLAICNYLATLMGGEITLSSETGKGSTFSLILDLSLAPPANGPIPNMLSEVNPGLAAPLQLPQDHSILPILVVDDHPINRDMLARQIKYLGLRAIVCENGLEALSLWKAQPYALVITDCQMPDMDGYALTRSIRQIESAAHLQPIPVIGWTANALTDEFDRCVAA
ncbi:MAG TPA: ATP-binding protein, partial [Burkholderiales bacterium]|nr:ATP-binding protein [Burkholderiales bacterium]